MAPDTGLKTRLKLAGQQYDQEVGLYYMRARYYDPALGRFLSEDPIGIAGGLNLYAYAGNDPVNRWDPYGLSADDPCDGGVARIRGKCTTTLPDQVSDSDDPTPPGLPIAFYVPPAGGGGGGLIGPGPGGKGTGMSGGAGDSNASTSSTVSDACKRAAIDLAINGALDLTGLRTYRSAATAGKAAFVGLRESAAFHRLGGWIRAEFAGPTARYVAHEAAGAARVLAPDVARGSAMGVATNATFQGAYVDIGVQEKFSWGDFVLSALPIVGTVKSGIAVYHECL